MSEDEDKQEEKFDFTSEGESLGYISLDEAQVLAIEYARDNFDFYGPSYDGVTLVWEVIGTEESEDNYDVRLSFRPSGRFRGEPGVEQLIFDKTGALRIRQLLDEPTDVASSTTAPSVPTPAQESPTDLQLEFSGTAASLGDFAQPQSSKLEDSDDEPRQGNNEVKNRAIRRGAIAIAVVVIVVAVLSAILSGGGDSISPAPIDGITGFTGASTNVAQGNSSGARPDSTDSNSSTSAAIPESNLDPSLKVLAALPPGNVIAFVSSRDGLNNIYLTNLDGSVVTSLAENATNPSWSPDGTQIAFNMDSYVHIIDLDGSNLVQLAKGGAPHWSPNGKLIAYYWNGHIYVINPTGSNIQKISEDPLGADTARWMPDGNKLLILKGLEGNLVTFDSNTSQVISRDPLNGPFQDWSPDGSWRAYTTGLSGGHDVYISGMDGIGGTHRITTGAEMNGPVRWSPDGTRMAYVSKKGLEGPGGGALFTMRSDGTDQRQQGQARSVQYISWSPDGSQIAYSGRDNGMQGEIFVVDVKSGTEYNLTNHGENDGGPRWQPSQGSFPDLRSNSVGSFALIEDPDLVSSIGTATQLPDGNVLITGYLQNQRSVQVFDQELERSYPISPMLTQRVLFTATPLLDGTVLIVGGIEVSDKNGKAIASSEQFDPVTQEFNPSGNMLTPRLSHTAVRLSTGDVLVMGGVVGSLNDQVIDTTAELYASSSGSFRITGNPTSPRRGFTATLLHTGDVLVTGGMVDGERSGSAEIYVESTGKFIEITGMSIPRSLHQATLLKDGRVLITGGIFGNEEAGSRAEIYDPDTGKFETVGAMNFDRREHSASILWDGRVLITGGVYNLGESAPEEIFDPLTGLFSNTPFGGSTLKFANVSAPLGDGRWLITGVTENKSELFTLE